MNEAEEKYLDVDHAILVVNQMFTTSETGSQNANLDESDKEELERFLRSDDDLEHYSLPALFGRVFFQDENMRRHWSTLVKLELDDRKLLMFTALGYEPNQVVESLGLSNSGSYWSRLRQLKDEYKSLGQVDFDEDIIREIEKELKELFNLFLDLSDQLEKDQIKTKNLFQFKHITLASFVILVLAYVFLWNLVIPPSGVEIFDNRIDPVIQSVIAYSDSVIWLPDVLFELELGNYTDALDILDEEMIIAVDMPTDLFVLWALFTVRERRFSDFREMLAEIKDLGSTNYEQHLKGLKWKTRFMK